MSKLFLIGNGFYINCGMKTKYQDGYNGYIEEPSNNDTIKSL